MSDLCRIGVALSDDLLAKFDKLIGQRGYTNRSEAFRDLIRNELVQETWKSSDAEVFGTVTLVYDHHARLLSEKLTELQHQYHAAVISTLHVHLDHDNCLEVILVKGKAEPGAETVECTDCDKGREARAFHGHHFGTSSAVVIAGPGRGPRLGLRYVQGLRKCAADCGACGCQALRLTRDVRSGYGCRRDWWRG